MEAEPSHTPSQDTSLAEAERERQALEEDGKRVDNELAGYYSEVMLSGPLESVNLLQYWNVRHLQLYLLAYYSCYSSSGLREPSAADVSGRNGHSPHISVSGGMRPGFFVMQGGRYPSETEAIPEDDGNAADA